jgi:hypothetical protein
MATGMSEEEAMKSLESHGLINENDDLEYTEITDSLAKLLDLVEKDVIAWRPEPGDVVAGTLYDITDSSEGDFGSYTILLIETPGETLVNVHCFHTILRREIDRRLAKGTLKTGDEIAIKYIGEAGRAGQGKSAPNLYRVVVNRP